MRLDYETTLAALKRAVGDLRNGNTSPGHYSARLYDVTTLLFENPLCVAALDEILAKRTAPIAEVSYRRALNAAIAAEVTGAARSLLALLPKARSANPSHAGYINAAQEWLRNEVSFGAASVPVATLLAELGNEPFPDLSMEKLSAVESLLRNGDNHVRTLEGFAWPTPAEMANVKQYQTASTAAQQRLSGQPQILKHVDDLADAASFTPIADNLRSLHQQITDLLAGTGVPLPQGAGLLKVWTGERAKSLANVERLVALVADRLSQSVVEQHALRRLRSYLAHFAKERIASEWATERTGSPASKPRRQFEAIIQSHVDGFLFSDGLFPITHADATGGSIDTFVPRSEHLFREASETHQRPVLIELKAVAWDGKDLKSALKNAVTRALDQAETYAAHLRANVTWRAHEVAVLVVYDGPTRYKTKNTTAALIYIGDATPSSGAVSIDTVLATAS